MRAEHGAVESRAYVPLDSIGHVEIRLRYESG